jgi:hypothetical protein
VKSHTIPFIFAAFLVAVFLSSGFASAITQDEGSANALFSSETLKAGQTVTVMLFFADQSADAVQISYVSIHFDWLPSGTYIGLNLTDAPVTIAAGGDHVFPAISMKIPDDISGGGHNFTIAVDGTDTNTSTSFSWESATFTKEIIGSNVTASPTATGTNSGGAGQTDLLLFAGVVVVVVVIGVLLLLIVLRKKGTKPQPAAKQDAGQPPAPSPDSKPEPGQDFNI